MLAQVMPAWQVIVVEDENGQIVRETMKDTDVLARYKTMHEILVYLSHLDHDDTENQMLEKLRLQVLCPVHCRADSMHVCHLWAAAGLSSGNSWAVFDRSHDQHSTKHEFPWQSLYMVFVLC